MKFILVLVDIFVCFFACCPAGQKAFKLNSDALSQFAYL